MSHKLYLVQNIMIFMEECLVALPSGNDMYTINPNYVRSEITFKNLQRDISKLYPELEYIPYERITDDKWDTVYMSSYVPDEQLSFYDSLNAGEIILVEDGLFDYVSSEDKYDFYAEKELYLFRPSLASALANKAEIHPLEISDKVIDKFTSIYKSELTALSSIDPLTPVLFTTPLGEDFNADCSITKEILDYIQRVFAPERIVLKRHPRDHFVYESDSLDIIECPQNIPGQLLDKIFEGHKLFLFPSTVSFMCGELSDITFINVLPGNEQYNNAFNGVINSLVFNDQKCIKIMLM